MIYMNESGFSEKIVALRKKHNLSQKELGRLLGVSNRAVSKWETGLSMPSGANVLKMAELFGLTTEPISEPQDSTFHDMESLTELYKIGRGPSSSHTIGPERACQIFKKRNPSSDRYHVILYGSLAKTGQGHGTDSVIRKTLAPCFCTVEFRGFEENIPHPNTMDLIAYRGERELERARVFSVGGGSIRFENASEAKRIAVYDRATFREIADFCNENRIRLWQYVEEREGTDFFAYMQTVWETMKDAVHRGLSDEGILPGGLGVHKKAKSLYNARHVDESAETREHRTVCAYAFAVSEQNAAGETIVTAPTCGAAGVLPAVLYYQQEKRGYSDTEIIHALETAGLIGNLIKTNASISGAECGCQVEIGSACAMASAALGELFGLSLDKIEYAAEMAIEHHLGLTCDPICGLVQIPCIERNAVAAMRAINAVSLAGFLSDTRKISFDKVVKVMKETGRDMSQSYKETAEGGLAKLKL